MTTEEYDKNNSEDNAKNNLESSPFINEKPYRYFFEYANDAMFILDYDNFIDCNSKSLEIFGCKKKEEILNFKPIDFSPKFQPDGTPSHIKAYNYIDKALQGKPQRFYWVHKKKDGTTFDCEVSLNSISKDFPKLVLAIVRDISFIKNMERQLIKLSLAVEQSPTSIVITDLEGNIEYVNPKFTEITGYSYEELIGNNPRILKSGWTSDGEYKILWDTISSGRTWKGIFKNKKKDGSYYWESALIAPIKDSSGKIINYIGVKEDITRQKELEEQLLQMQKLESIGTLTGGIAHDFNNILTAINGYAQLLISKINSNEPLYDYAKNILAGGERAAELVKKLLAFSRKQIIQPEIVNINDIIKEVENILKNTIDEDIDVYLELGNISLIKADPSQIEQLLINLITNARDAVKQKSLSNNKIVIKTENRYIDNHFADRHPGLKKGQYIILAVEDNGIGMDEKTKKKIFEPFFTTKPIWLGTGLGLSTVYGIVKQNNGYIDVFSKQGVGTKIEVYWPVIKEDDGYFRKTSPSMEISDFKAFGKGEKILLVEDNKTVRDFVYQSLSQSNYDVTTAEDGISALNLFEDETVSSKIKLIISDIVMPKMGGIELIKKIKEKYPEIKAILITGYPLDNKLDLDIISDNIYFLHKPFKYKELVNLIAKILK